MTTDTPRTDAAQLWHFDEPVVPKEFAQQLERELAHSLANQVKSQAEVEMFRKDNAALTYVGANLESHNWNLKRELESTEEALQQMTEDAVNLKAEVERLTESSNELLKERNLEHDACNNYLQILDDRKVEVEKLREILNRSLYAYFYEKSERELRKTMLFISKEYEQLGFWK
jgi:hypothetical protein